MDPTGSAIEAMTPTARSLAFLRRSGYLAEVVERWLPIPGRNVRRDLWGFGDLIAVRQGIPGALIVQATTGSNVAARLTKARKLLPLATWLRCGNTFEVWGWEKRNDTWEVRRVMVRAGDLCPEELGRPARRRRKKEHLDLFTWSEKQHGS
jgi:hypothetical protein